MAAKTSSAVRKMKTEGPWALKTIPSFAGFSCLVLPGCFYSQTVAMMAKAGFSKAKGIEDADLVVFTGGADISPKLYGQKAHSSVNYCDTARDAAEMKVFEECVKLRTPMFGICRGAQFLWAMNGGKLWQHVTNHHRNHTIIDLEEGLLVEANSLHHQMMKLNGNTNLSLLAVTEHRVTDEFHDAHNSIVIKKDSEPSFEELEIEAAWCDKTKCLMIQGHPELGTPEYQSWALSKLHDFFFDWTNNDKDPTVDPDGSGPATFMKEIIG